MDKIYTLKEVTEILQNQGISAEEITKVLLELNKLAFTKFYSEAMLVFKDQDFDEIEACQTQKEASIVIAKLYHQRTGQDAEHLMDKFISDFAKGFIKKYQKEKINAKS